MRCPECGHIEARPFYPLFIVTGPSGVGKTAVVSELQRLLPDWEIFETDILWDSGQDWQMIKCNWLRIADSLAARPHGRPTILCGTMVPADLEACSERLYFQTIHWLALLCDADVLAQRLQARPAWRGCTEAFIAEHLQFADWLREQAATAFDPPLTLLDTTHASIAQTAGQIRDWAVARRNLE